MRQTLLNSGGSEQEDRGGTRMMSTHGLEMINHLPPLWEDHQTKRVELIALAHAKCQNLKSNSYPK